MEPRGDLASTKYCLAKPGAEYLIYRPAGKERAFVVHLKRGRYLAEWFNPGDGTATPPRPVTGSDTKHVFTGPFAGPAVLYLDCVDN